MDQTLVTPGLDAGLGASADLSIVGLFLLADPLVKAVMIMLVLASIWCWAIIFEKLFKVRQLRSRASDF